MSVKEKLKKAEERTNTNPTEGQKKGGNYKKGKVIIKGLRISIENPKGTTRSGTGRDGVAWSNKMPFTYGYFNGTIGKDGDPIDVYIGGAVEDSFDVYVIDQVEEKSRAFDEHKVMLGFKDKETAKKAYLSCYNVGWTGFQSITALSLNKFKSWIKNKDAIKYPASRLNMSSKIDFKNKEIVEGIKLIQLHGEVIEGETLASLKEQAGDIEKIEALVVEIASPGGSVAEGLEIMVWLDRLSKAGKEIITVVTANAYSIASLIMLAADTKLISRHGEVMVHNPMVPELSYANAAQLEEYASQLRGLENLMYELYEIFTGMELGQIKALMDNETYLSPQEAVHFGFADMVVDIQPKSYEVATNNKKEVNMHKTINRLNKVIGMVNGDAFVNQLYYNLEGGEINISQKNPSAYAVGDRTDVKEGEVKLSDGSKLEIKAFVIESIDKSIEPTVAGDFNEGPAPKKAIKEEVEAIKDEDEVVAKEEGEVIAAEQEEVVAKEDEEIKAVEEEEVIEAAEEEEVIEEKPMEEEIVEEIVEGAKEGEEIIEEPIEQPMEEPIEVPVIPQEEMNAEILKQFSKLESRIEELEKERKEILSKFESRFIALEKFEDKAGETLEVLAGKTVSNFKPKAKVVIGSSPKGSIFQNLKKKRGL